MNWPLTFTLSLFGLAMSVGTVFFISSTVEPFYWLAIFVVCAWVIARRAGRRVFMHGLMVGILNGVWMTTGHVLFFDRYATSHASEMGAFAAAPLPPRMLMFIVGPVIGVVSGAVLGLLAIGVSKVVRTRR